LEVNHGWSLIGSYSQSRFWPRDDGNEFMMVLVPARPAVLPARLLETDHQRMEIEFPFSKFPALREFREGHSTEFIDRLTASYLWSFGPFCRRLAPCPYRFSFSASSYSELIAEKFAGSYPNIFGEL
jgi:hypothetical protein